MTRTPVHTRALARRPTRAGVSARALTGPVALALAAAVALAPARARAQTAPATRDELLQRGFELRQRHDDAGALALFIEAVERFHDPQALAQQGLAEQALGRWGEAATHLRFALTHTHDLWIQQNRRALEHALATVERHTGRVEVLCNVPGANVSLNGRVVGATPMDAPADVSAGTVSIEVRAEGYVTVQRVVELAPRVLHRESVDLVRVVASAPAENTAGSATAPGSAACPGGAHREASGLCCPDGTREDAASAGRCEPVARCGPSEDLRAGVCVARGVPPVRAHTGSSGPGPLFYIAGGIALVAAGVAVALSVDGQSVANGYEASCGAGVAAPAQDCPTRYAALQPDLDSRALGVNILWGVTVLGAAVSVVSLFVGRPSEPAAPRRGASVRVGPGAAMLEVRW